MKQYQKINHFVGMSALARKNNLARNLAKMSRVFADDYKFAPRTWLIPTELNAFR
jgi:tubulin polyglutamylase TTLL6/13